MSEIEYNQIMRDYQKARMQQAEQELGKDVNERSNRSVASKKKTTTPKMATRAGKTKKDRSGGAPNRRREMIAISRDLGRRLSQEEIAAYRRTGDLPGRQAKTARGSK